VRGLQVSSGPIYGGSALFLALVGFTSYLSTGKYWRYLIFTALFVLEIHTITRPYSSPLLTTVMNPILGLLQHPPLLPFQLILLARKATFTIFIAFSQLSSLIPQPPTSTLGTATPHDLQQLARLEGIAQQTELEAIRLLAMDMAPFAGDEQGTKDLRGRVREWLVTNTIRSDPEVRDAMGRALGKRRMLGAPGGK